ncbi:MAG: rhodanese-related sulfurtransferase [Melioribacteraceae bacterium]|nr:rhodanese-related sulfurtransferase [Melioribacteraceae bacterium]
MDLLIKSDLLSLIKKLQKMSYRILLFYKYVKFSNPEQFRNDHLKFCTENDILGRVWISDEGINGTVSGLLENISRYKQEVKKYPEFADLWFKEDQYEQHAFNKIHVRVKKEIVNASFGKVDLSKTGKRLEPNQLLELYKSNTDFLIVDARNDYESKIGKFKNAVTPQMNTFRDWPRIAEELKEYKNKTVITYCTGGIRCEKASAYLVENGFTDVYQLNGGIWNFINQHPDTYWEGSMFVFDERRIVSPNNKDDLKHTGKCFYCGTPASYYINCHNQSCDIIIVTCDTCKEINKYCCSDECRNSPNQRTRIHG